MALDLSPTEDAVPWLADLEGERPTTLAEDVATLYHFCPHAHATVLGPVPLGGDARLHVDLDYIIKPTTEEQVDAVWDNIRQLCAHYGYAFDPMEWDLVHWSTCNMN